MDDNEKLHNIQQNMNLAIALLEQVDNYAEEFQKPKLLRQANYKMQRAQIEATLLVASKSEAIARQQLLANQMTYIASLSQMDRDSVTGLDRQLRSIRNELFVGVPE